MILSRIRYWAMYAASSAVGYILGGVMMLLGGRFRRPLKAMVRETARAHADEAARREGAYLAPLTLAAGLLLVSAGGAVLVRWLS